MLQDTKFDSILELNSQSIFDHVGKNACGKSQFQDLFYLRSDIVQFEIFNFNSSPSPTLRPLISNLTSDSLAHSKPVKDKS